MFKVIEENARHNFERHLNDAEAEGYTLLQFNVAKFLDFRGSCYIAVMHKEGKKDKEDK